MAAPPGAAGTADGHQEFRIMATARGPARNVAACPLDRRLPLGLSARIVRFRSTEARARSTRA
jgi:hypothetical protein